MASERKSFSELLNEAPLASAEKTVSITGVLARSNDPGKFVLTTGDNQTITLDVDAVKEHKVLSHMVGQLVVQVEVDKDRVPKMAEANEEIRTNPIWDYHRTAPIIDSNPLVDRYIYKNIIENTGTIQENVVDPGNFGVDPAVAQGYAPFALATAPQAPQAMFREPAQGSFNGPVTPIWNPQLGGGMGAGSFRTTPIYDLHSVHYLDKPPIADITGNFPYPD